MELTCFECGDAVVGNDLDSLGDAFVDHARSQHEWPYSDQGIRNFAHATQRLTGSLERLDEIGEITVHRVTEDRIGDWLDFFDHHAFVGTPEWAACYCLEPHVRKPDTEEVEDPDWRTNREAMITRLREGETFGYLAYVDAKPAGWVNASTRDQYTYYRTVDPNGPAAEDVIGISCFIVAPPYRQHGVAESLLEQVMADATERGAAWVEAYPFNESTGDEAKSFRGPRPMFDSRRFEPVEIRGRDTVVRRSV